MTKSQSAVQYKKVLINKFNTKFVLWKINNHYMTQFPLPGYDGLCYGFNKVFKTKKEALDDANSSV